MTAPANTRQPHLIFAGMSLSAGDGILQADGSLWSHACTLGTRIKGTQFTIDKTVVDNFLKVFASGYPQKVPVDYDHGSTTDDPEARAARYAGRIPKAGDVLEMRSVYGAEDFKDSLRTAAGKLAKEAGRELEDPRNYGLWIRWRPTAKALQSIKEREYTELSIAFDDDYPHNSTGEGQGPAILAVALLNLPFLDDMLPVAASRHGGSPAAPGNGEERMTKLTLLAVTAAFLGKPVADEDQAITELQALQPDITGLRKFRTDVGAAIGEPDPAKAIAKITELTTKVTRLEGEVGAATKAKIEGQVTATMTKYEKRMTVPLKTSMATQLRAELEKGTELEKTETVKVLESLKELGITEQVAGGDLGGANADYDVKLDAKARELQASNPRIKQLSEKDPHEGYKAALLEAERLLKPQLVTA